MNDPTKHTMPKGAKYPLFFLGLLLMIVGGIAAQTVSLGIYATAVIAAVGFVLLIISVAIK